MRGSVGDFGADFRKRWWVPAGLLGEVEGHVTNDRGGVPIGERKLGAGYSTQTALFRLRRNVAFTRDACYNRYARCEMPASILGKLLDRNAYGNYSSGWNDFKQLCGYDAVVAWV